LDVADRSYSRASPAVNAPRGLRALNTTKPRPSTETSVSPASRSQRSWSARVPSAGDLGDRLVWLGDHVEPVERAEQVDRSRQPRPLDVEVVDGAERPRALVVAHTA
jgi:hypothetical protein